MKLYIRQKIFTIGDKFSVYDENGNEKYRVESELFSIPKRFRIFDLNGYELMAIEKRMFTLLPKYFILRNGNQVGEVIKEFTFFSNEYTVEGPGWTVSGNFLDHDYDVKDRNGTAIASVAKEWLTWGDVYEINIWDNVDEILALSVVIVIDECLDRQKN